MSIAICQLATRFCCSCPKCLTKGDSMLFDDMLSADNFSETSFSAIAASNNNDNTSSASAFPSARSSTISLPEEEQEVAEKEKQPVSKFVVVAPPSKADLLFEARWAVEQERRQASMAAEQGEAARYAAENVQQDESECFVDPYWRCDRRERRRHIDKVLHQLPRTRHGRRGGAPRRRHLYMGNSRKSIFGMPWLFSRNRVAALLGRWADQLYRAKRTHCLPKMYHRRPKVPGAAPRRAYLGKNPRAPRIPPGSIPASRGK